MLEVAGRNQEGKVAELVLELSCSAVQAAEAHARQVAERLTRERRAVGELSTIISPEMAIPAPAMGTDARVVAWLMDTYSMHHGHAVPGVVTGKPVVIGGSSGRFEATGRGVLYVTQEACREQGTS